MTVSSRSRYLSVTTAVVALLVTLFCFVRSRQSTEPALDPGLADRHRAMLDRLAVAGSQFEGGVALCFAPGTPDSVREEFEALVFGQTPEFQIAGRWTSTATTPGTVAAGDPVVLTYSFVPDGTPIPSGAGEPAAPSNLIAAFNSAFPSQATWQNLVHQVFARWSEVSGNTYVFEPNDDGASHGSSPGALGVRGDVRIGGHLIDGGSGILAFNSFPSNGDMVLDTGDLAFFGTTTSNYRRFRNTVAHEHGHGLGIAHVCPSTQTKLMEPFISTVYDGPQEDDILAVQRNYGDPNESNDSVAAATDLGTLGFGVNTVTQVSLDRPSDVDIYRFSTPINSQLTATLRPIGSTYIQGPQTQACNTGASFSAGIQNDVAFQLLAANGTTVLATANSAPIGQPESVVGLFLPSGAGPYHVRVTGGTSDAIQRYELDLSLSPGLPPAFTVAVPGAPTVTIDGVRRAIEVVTTANPGQSVPNVGALFASVNGGVFTSTSLTSLGGGRFAGVLPLAPCLTDVRWYVSLVPVAGGSPITAPLGAPGTVFTTAVAPSSLTNLVVDDFETNTGWTVTDSATLTDGTFVRGVPVGGGTRGDPPAAFGGSGACFLTDNVAGNSDVDNGSTTLTSPVYDLSGQSDVRMVCSLWYDNDFGASPNLDVLLVQASSNNGGAWVTLEAYPNGPNQWVQRNYTLPSFLPLTAQMRFRFVVEDVAPGSVVEAGVDAFRLQTCTGFQGVGSLGTAAQGNYPLGGSPTPLVFVNGITGGAERRIDVGRNDPFLLELRQPTTSATPTGFVLFAKIGIAAPANAFVLPLGLGDMAFAPCLFAPGDLTSFVWADTYGLGLCGPTVAPAAGTPWAFLMPGVGFLGQVTLQAVLDQGNGQFAVSNGVAVNLF